MNINLNIVALLLLVVLYVGNVLGIKMHIYKDKSLKNIRGEEYLIPFLTLALLFKTLFDTKRKLKNRLENLAWYLTLPNKGLIIAHLLSYYLEEIAPKNKCAERNRQPIIKTAKNVYNRFGDIAYVN